MTGFEIFAAGIGLLAEQFAKRGVGSFSLPRDNPTYKHVRANGSEVTVSACVSNEDRTWQPQRWPFWKTFPADGVLIYVRLNGYNKAAEYFFIRKDAVKGTLRATDMTKSAWKAVV